MKNVKTIITISSLSIIGLAVLFFGYIAIRIAMVRVQMVEKAIEEVARETDKNSSSQLIVKFTQMLQQSVSQQEISAQTELSLMYIFMDMGNEENQVKKEYRLDDRIAIYFINFARQILGKPALDFFQVDIDDTYIKRGFVNEISKKYKESIKEYDTFLTKYPNAPADLLTKVLLHRGFCLALLNEFEKAKYDWESVIDLAKESSKYQVVDDGRVADQLIRLLKTFEDLKKEIEEKYKDDPIEMAKQLFLIGQTKLALAALEGQQGDTKELQSKALYYRGRSYEELGEIDFAIDSYREVVTNFSNTQFWRPALERLLLLRKIREKDPELQKITNIIKTEIKEDITFFENQINAVERTFSGKTEIAFNSNSLDNPANNVTAFVDTTSNISREFNRGVDAKSSVAMGESKATQNTEAQSQAKTESQQQQTQTQTQNQNTQQTNNTPANNGGNQDQGGSTARTETQVTPPPIGSDTGFRETTSNIVTTPPPKEDVNVMPGYEIFETADGNKIYGKIVINHTDFIVIDYVIPNCPECQTKLTIDKAEIKSTTPADAKEVYIMVHGTDEVEVLGSKPPIVVDSTSKEKETPNDATNTTGGTGSTNSETSFGGSISGGTSSTAKGNATAN